MRGLSKLIVLTAGATALALVIPAQAHASPAPETIVQGLAGPLQFDVGAGGQIYVGQDFAGTLTKVRLDGSTTDLVSRPGTEIAGVASRGYDVVFTSSNGGETTPATKTALERRFANGTVHTIANLLKFEQTHNPDAGNVYGFRNLSTSCANQLPAEIGPASYTGVIDSHPYAVANAPDGGWYVADAAGNDILKVSPSGDVSVVFVFRPQPTTITADAAAANGLPACTVGKVYAFEPVPTDVEVKSNGSLIVSLLPGGPEDPSLGARGKVLRVALDGEFATLADGLAGATNVAIGAGGRVYVTELFANRVSVIQNHAVTTVADLPSPAGVEYANGTLYVSTDVFGNGSIVKIDVP